MNFNPDVAHNDLPLLPPDVVVESIDVLRCATAARVAVMELETMTRLLPDPTVLINALPLVEAQASSAIENIVTTTDALFRHEIATSRPVDPATREAARYRTALREGYELIESRPISTTTAKRICSVVVGHDTDLRRDDGTFIGDYASQTRIYTPPAGRETLSTLMGNWEKYVNTRDEVDPLIRLAIAHYQFEAIHPFPDGNGRTGRILNSLLLTQWGLLSLPVLYMSTFIIATKQDYYAKLLAVTERSEWREWILYFVRGIEQSAIAATRTVERVVAARQLVEDRLVSIHGKPNALLLRAMFVRPYMRIRGVQDECGVSRPTATKWLAELEDAGILESVRDGRDKIFLNRPFIDALQG